MASQNPNPSRFHIAVLAFPFGTHAPPLLRLARDLSAALGPASTVSFLSTARSNGSLSRDPAAFGRVKPFDVADGLPDGHAPPRNPIEAMEAFIGAAPGNFGEAISAAESEVGERLSCVVSDAFLSFAGDLAAERGVPWFPVWMAAARSLLVHLETDEIRRRSSAAEEEGTLSKDQILDFLPRFMGFRVSDLPEEVLVINGSESSLSTLLHNMGRTLPKAAAVVVNSFRGFDPKISDHLGTKLGRLLHVGPLLASAKQPDPHGCLEWLSRHETASVVYIGFGSLGTLPPHEAAELTKALAEMKLPFLWSTRNPHNVDDAGELGKVVTWAPQAEVLGHPAVGVFVTHCGWNSVVECVVGGVAPMVCRPFFGDQCLNMRTVEAVWGIGVGAGDDDDNDGGERTGGSTKESFVKALKRVLGEEGKGMRERIGVLKRSLVHNEDFNALVELILKSA